MSQGSSSNHDDLEPETYKIMKNIEECLVKEDDVSLEEYLRFWKHVCIVMGNWGTIFGFVVRDVQTKLGKLEEMRTSNPEAYKSIQSMAQMEYDTNTIRNQKPNRSGTGHMMVLNRALEFVVDLLNGVFMAKDENERVSGIAKTSYDKNLSHYHSWPIRQLVAAALLTLPRKNEFLIRLRGKMPANEDERFHLVFEQDGREIINRVNQLVVKFELTDYDPSR